MGAAMAGNLLKAGFAVVGYDVRSAARDALRQQGGTALDSAQDVAAQADIIILSLPSVAALDAVTEELMRSGRPIIAVETSTLPLDAKESARSRLAGADVTLLDCPLSGTGAQAREKDLVVYASGPREAFEQCRAVFEGFSRAQHYLGAFGAGSKLKYITNLLVAIHNVATAEALVLAEKAGLETQDVFNIISGSAGASRMFQIRGPMMVEGDYSNAMMTLDLWQKDMAIISGFASSVGCPVPLFTNCLTFYTAAIAGGREKQDPASVCAVLGELAGLKPKSPTQAR
jgi:3-hydroxyisobutyrate dehydrogenase-like beta-hydroxyacid dehydrogenase